MMKYPIKQEQRYKRLLHQVSSNLRSASNNEIARITALLDGKLRNDETDRTRLLDQIKDAYYKENNKDGIIEEINDICNDVDISTRKELIGELEEQTGGTIKIDKDGKVVDIEDEWIELQNEFVEDLENSFWYKLAILLGIALLMGSSFKDTREQINKLYQQIDKRAELIAMNEISSLSGATNKQYQEQLGIKVYRWQTMEDERVRKSHNGRNKKLYYWNSNESGKINGEVVNPTPNSYPSQEIGCRCMAIPIYESRV